MVWCVMLWCVMVCYGVVCYGVVCVVWCVMLWFVMVWCALCTEEETGLRTITLAFFTTGLNHGGIFHLLNRLSHGALCGSRPTQFDKREHNTSKMADKQTLPVAMVLF